MTKENVRLARVARRQHGLWTRGQVAAAGVDQKEIQRRLRDGDWVEVRREVFCAASRPPDAIGAILAICLEIGAPVAASGPAAAFVRRFPLIQAPTLVTVLVPLNRRVLLHDGRVERSRRFPASVPRVDGVPVLSRVDTLITLAEQMPIRLLVDCLQELTRQGGLPLEDVRSVLTRGRSGSAALRRAVVELREGGDSKPERQLYLALRAGGVPGFEFGWELVLRDGTRYRPGLWNDLLGFCIEVDGVATHAVASRMESDRVRDNRLDLLGIRVVLFTLGDDGLIRFEVATGKPVEVAREASVEPTVGTPSTRGDFVARNTWHRSEESIALVDIETRRIVRRLTVATTPNASGCCQTIGWLGEDIVVFYSENTIAGRTAHRLLGWNTRMGAVTRIADLDASAAVSLALP